MALSEDLLREVPLVLLGELGSNGGWEASSLSLCKLKWKVKFLVLKLLRRGTLIKKIFSIYMFFFNIFQANTKKPGKTKKVRKKMKTNFTSEQLDA